MLLFALSACGLDNLPPPDGEGQDTNEPVTYGSLELSGSTVDFGYVDVGSWGDETLVLSNTGDDPIELLNATLGNPVFSIDAVTGTIDGGGELVLTLTFEPSSSTDYTDSLALETDDPDAGVVYVDVVGTAVPQDDTGNGDGGSYLDVSWVSHDFGEVDIKKGDSVALTLTNTGDEALLVTDFVASDDSIVGWGEEFTLPYVIDVGSTKDVTVTFTPTEEKTYNETLTVTSDANNDAAVDLSIVGSGFHGCDICGPLISVDTGSTDAYSISDFFVLVTDWGNTDTRSIEIWNEGDEDLVVTSVDVENDTLQTDCYYSVKGFSGSKTITPWAYDTIDVTYTANATCVIDSGTLTIESNDLYEPVYQISLLGSAFGQ